MKIETWNYKVRQWAWLISSICMHWTMTTVVLIYCYPLLDLMRFASSTPRHPLEMCAFYIPNLSFVTSESGLPQRTSASPLPSPQSWPLLTAPPSPSASPGLLTLHPCDTRRHASVVRSTQYKYRPMIVSDLWINWRWETDFTRPGSETGSVETLCAAERGRVFQNWFSVVAIRIGRRVNHWQLTRPRLRPTTTRPMKRGLDTFSMTFRAAAKIAAATRPASERPPFLRRWAPQARHAIAQAAHVPSLASKGRFRPGMRHEVTACVLTACVMMLHK